jgi:hypothetical protein
VSPLRRPWAICRSTSKCAAHRYRVPGAPAIRESARAAAVGEARPRPHNGMNSGREANRPARRRSARRLREAVIGDTSALDMQLKLESDYARSPKQPTMRFHSQNDVTCSI